MYDEIIVLVTFHDSDEFHASFTSAFSITETFEIPQTKKEGHLNDSALCYAFRRGNIDLYALKKSLMDET